MWLFSKNSFKLFSGFHQYQNWQGTHFVIVNRTCSRKLPIVSYFWFYYEIPVIWGETKTFENDPKI